MEEEGGSQVEPEKVVGFEGEANEVSYTKRDLLLYALGIGCVCYAIQLRTAVYGWDGCYVLFGPPSPFWSGIDRLRIGKSVDRSMHSLPTHH